MSENEDQNRNLRIKQQKNSLMKRLLICVVILAVFTVVFLYVNRSARGTEIDLNTFYEQLWSGNVKRVEIKQSKIQVYYNNNDPHWFYNRPDTEANIQEQWIKMLQEGKEVPKLVSGTTTTISIINILYPIAGIVITILIIIFVVKQLKGANNKNYEFVKSRARIYPSKTKFSDVAGADEEKQELEDVVDFLKNPKKYTAMGAKIPKGVILVGPPGTGKTLLARAVAGEANVPFFTISGSDFMELFVGVGASRVRDLFENAKKAKPCIIFIDEIDAVGRQRGAGLGGGNDEREQTLNQLLVQMDGFETNEGIIVMAATNRVDILDPALLRPGRFDRRINISLPDVKGREEILKVHARGKVFSGDVNFKTIARITSGFTGAELENLLNEAAILVAKENRSKITNIDIQKSIMKVSLGPQKRSRVTEKKDQFDTAVHEAGHAIVSRLAEEKTPVHEVSIIPRGGAGGYTVSTDDEDYSVYFRKKLLCKIEMLLGGITAEKLYVGDISTGASNDLKRASSIARRMVTEWGMSADVGMVYCGNDDEVFIGKSYQERVPYSESQGQIIDSEIKKIIDYCQAETEKILTENKDKLMTMVDVLLARETIYTEEVQMILDGKTKDEIIAYIDGKDKNGESGILFDQYKKEDSENNQPSEADLANSIIDTLLKIAEDREKESGKTDAETKVKVEDNKTDEVKAEETKQADAKETETEKAEVVETEQVETKEADAGEVKEEVEEAETENAKTEEVEVNEVEIEEAEPKTTEQDDDEDESDLENIDEEVAESVVPEDKEVIAQENEDAREIAEIETVKQKSRRGRRKKSETEKEGLGANSDKMHYNDDLNSLNAQFLSDNEKVEEPKKKRGRKPKEKTDAVLENNDVPAPAKKRGRPPKKNLSESENAEKPKRRGRPPKNTSEK